MRTLFQANVSHDVNSYKSELISLLEKVHKTLDDARVRHSAVFGSCLGAVRHHGIIPWDDDVDISVNRKDFNRALVALRNACGELYVWDWHTDNSCPIPYARVFFKIDGSCTIEHYRAYLDIFIIEGTFQCAFLRHLESTVLRALISTIKYKGGVENRFFPSSICFTTFLKLSFLPLLLFPISVAHWLYEFLVCLPRSGFCVQCPFEYGFYSNTSLPADIFDRTRIEKFDRIQVTVPFYAEEYLRLVYGDWQTPPPEDKRRGFAWSEGGEWNVPMPTDELRIKN